MIAATALFALVAVVVSRGRGDVAPPNVEDLALAPVEARPEPNGWLDLARGYVEARSALPEGVDTSIDAVREQVAALVIAAESRAAPSGGEAPFDWDPDEARALVALGRPVVLGVERALKAPVFRLPRPRAHGDAIEAQRVTSLACGLVALEAALALEEGDWHAAIDRLLTLVALGHGLQESGGGLLLWLLGNDERERAFALLRRILERAPPDVDDCARVVAALADSEASTQGVVESVRIEFALLEAVVSGLGSGSVAPPLAGFGAAALEGKPVQSNRTRALFADACRQAMRLAARSVRGSAEEIAVDLGYGANAGGERLYALFAPSILGVAERRFRELAAQRLTRVAFALAAHEAESGALPANLRALVPEHLDAVPADPFDGAPLRYSVELGALWSVGEDLIDRAVAGASTAAFGARLDPAQPTVSVGTRRVR